LSIGGLHAAFRTWDRRAKTDRLDTQLLMRAFLGWLRGERRHCSMAAIPTIEEEDAKRPNREHEKLVGDRTRIVNRMKSTLARLGIPGFKPTLRKAEEKLRELRTAERTLLPDNTREELRRDMARLRVVREQIKEIEQQRLRKLEAATPAEKGPHAMVRVRSGNARARCRSEVVASAARHGLCAVVKNGAATLEPRSRCALLHHGSGLAGPPHTSTRV
jgi:hypothetical protein